MCQEIDLAAIHSQIRVIKAAARQLQTLGPNFPAINSNTARILASLKMLELNVSDLIEVDADGTDSYA